MAQFTRKIGMNKGKVRLWLEGAILNTNGFPYGMRFDIETSGTTMTITANPNGKRKIAGKPGREIIDMSASTITDPFPTAKKGDVMQIFTLPGTLVITR